MAQRDRRRYFRINDWVDISYRSLDEITPEAPETQAFNVRIETAQVLASLDKELQEAMNLLWQNNPLTANALSLINKKLNVVTTELNLTSSVHPEGEGVASRVNISACGIAFETDDRYPPGELLELNLTLKPEGNQVRLKGQVVACEKAPESEKACLLRVNFIQLDAAIEEELIQHIVRRQSQQLALNR